MKSIKELQKNTFTELKEQFGYTSPMQAPRIIKVILSSATGSLKDKSKVEVIQDRLAKFSGQKPAPRQAKKSIAGFKIRQGNIVGYQVTLRGARMVAFLDKLIGIALPRTKDFRGLKRESVDEMGNLTIGIKEHIVFPETADEDLRDVFGLAVTIVTTAKNKEEALAFFEQLGFPLKRSQLTTSN